MRKHLQFKELITAVAIAAMGCSTYTHDAVQTNSPAPAPMRGAALNTPKDVNSAGPASMPTPGTDALAIAAANSGYAGRVLGTVQVDGSSPSGNVSEATGQVLPPAYPGLSVNSTIYSEAHPVITSGLETGAVTVTTAPAATTASVTSAPLTAAPTATATAAPTIPSSNPLVTATGTSVANTGTPTPTISSTSIASPTVASNPPIASASRTSTTAATTTTAARVPITGTATAVGVLGANGMTSSSTITNSSAPVRSSALGTATTTSSVSRIRAVRNPAVIATRQRPVRVTTAPDGTKVVTNQ